jgi:sugar lactone lactonase YvrE
MRFYHLIIPLILSLSAMSQTKEELFFPFGQPMGNVAVTQVPNRPFQVFFTIHPESKPKTGHVYEIRNKAAVPFPDSGFQSRFISPLGIYLDRQNRLWVLDHANYAQKTPKLFAFDASSGALLLEYEFSKEIVRKWVMLNDLSVTPDGNHVIISAPGMFKKRSSMIVFDVAGQRARRLLTDHPTVMRKKILPEVDGKKMRFLLGLIKVRPGIDGIDIDPSGKYIYYAAMADTVVYRIPVQAVTDPTLDDKTLESLIHTFGYRPLCDGIRIDRQERLYITDFQNHRILAMDPDGTTETIVENDRIRWADGLSVGRDGFLYITDSALQHVILKKEKKYKEHAPFGIWRIKVMATD